MEIQLFAPTSQVGNPTAYTVNNPAPPFEGTREEWAERIVVALFPMLVDEGITPVGNDRGVRIAIAPLPASKLGVCYSANKSRDGSVNIITLSTAEADPAALVHTLLHELWHAFDDCRSGHRNRWKRWANHIGIEIRGTDVRGPIAARMVNQALAEVGVPLSHVVTVYERDKARSSQVRFECPKCGIHVHMPLKLADDARNKVGCVGCSVVMVRGMEGV